VHCTEKPNKHPLDKFEATKMDKQTFRLTRQDLYNQVWSKPLRHLAKEYGLSDVGLSKLCRRHNIPLPPTGYWMKVSHGYRPPKLPLPPAERGKSEIIEIATRQPQTYDTEKYADVLKEFQAIKRDGLKIEFPQSAKDLHPLLKQTQKYFKTAKPENDSRLRPCRQGCVDIRVSPEAVDRALRIMHALIRLLESQGLSVWIQEEPYTGTYVKILGEDLKICLKEKVKRSEKVQTSPYDNKYEFRPLGLLFFETEDYYAPGLQHTWEDTPSSELEDKLLEISDGLIERALRRRIERMEREEADRKRNEDQERKEVEVERQKLERAQFDKLLKDATDWQTSQLLRSYIEAVRKSVSDGEPDSETSANLKNRLAWAERKADELDPVRNSDREH